MEPEESTDERSRVAPWRRGEVFRRSGVERLRMILRLLGCLSNGLDMDLGFHSASS